MASLPPSDRVPFERELGLADEVVWIETALIDMGPRLRAPDEIWAGALGDLMLREGQRAPIDVCHAPDGRFRLAGAGGHRLLGAQLREIEAIKCVVWSPEPEAALLREIADNLHRRDLAPYERATFIAEAVACYKRRAGIDPMQDGRAASANARWQKAVKDEASDATVTLTVAYGWAASVASELGISKSAVERDITLYRRLDPAIVEKLREERHSVLDNAAQLRALAKVDARKQGQVAQYLIDGAARSVAEAIGAIEAKPETDPAAKRLSTFLGTFGRMSLSERKGALEALMPQLPAGFRIVIGEEA